MTLDEAVATLREVPCPRCLSLGGLAIMVCGPGRAECDSVGQCSNCGYTFDLEFAAVALDRLKHEARVTERVDPCPGCGAHDAEIHFACGTRKHTCFFVATCRVCAKALQIVVRSDEE